ncbi:MAG: hypothetical protein EAZ15_07505 [Sphingobacteriales bacterium]|nr:MAG: hypothetical protein EAZ15_07505 [Sphingobacteriales bacterium]
MKVALNKDLTFDQIFALVKQLPRQEKIKLTKELEKDTIEFKLKSVLESFKTNDLSLDTINQEVEIVRQQYYEGQKH